MIIKPLIVVLSILTQPKFAFDLPDIVWDPDYPLFDSQKCDESSRVIHARINDVVSILCGNEDLNLGFVQSNRKKGFNFNIYMTSSKKSYHSRNSTYSKKLKDCVQKKAKSKESQQMDIVVVKHKEKLKEFSPMGGHIYKAGESYYFFTTSDGSEASLNNDVGNENSKMGFEVYICKEDRNCNERRQWNGIVCGSSEVLPSSQPQFAESDNKKTLIIHIVIGVCGFAVGMLVCFVLQRRRCRSQFSKTSDGSPRPDLHRLSSTASTRPMLKKEEEEQQSTRTMYI